MISIDFVPGTHGHFLELMCNKYITGQDIDFDPFNSLGASHTKFNNEQYNKNKLFKAEHYSIDNKELSRKVIRIVFDFDDLLPLTAGTFLRAGDSNIELNELEDDTYNKLFNSKYFSYIIDSLNTAYPELNLSETNPHCPRYVLREFFKFGFMHPEQNGLVLELKKLTYPLTTNSIDFSYKNFYNKRLFVNGINQIAEWLGKSCTLEENNSVWEKFVNFQKFKSYKLVCDEIISCVNNKKSVFIPKLSLLQESYINGVLEKQFGVEMPFVQPNYFTSTAEIIKHLCLK